ASPSEDGPPRHSFNVEDEDWKNTPPKVQGAFVAMLTELERLQELVRFLIGEKHGRKSEKSKKHERQESGEPELSEEDPEAQDDDGEDAESSSDTTEAPESDLPPPPPPPPGLGRKPLPSHLPRRRVILDVPAVSNNPWWWLHRFRK
ncbi:MAG: transposase domain-containing protein, partial [Candidatus Xenobia bacterium]